MYTGVKEFGHKLILEPIGFIFQKIMLLIRLSNWFGTLYCNATNWVFIPSLLEPQLAFLQFDVYESSGGIEFQELKISKNYKYVLGEEFTIHLDQNSTLIKYQKDENEEQRNTTICYEKSDWNCQNPDDELQKYM